MRKLIYAVSLAFALGGLAPLAQAECSGAHAAKKNDMETPAPATSGTETKKNQG